MRKISDELKVKLNSQFRELDKLGLAVDDSGVILYLLTLLKEKIDFQIKTDSNPINNDLSLFQNEEARLELSVEEIRIELNDIPPSQSYLTEVNKIFSAELNILSIKSYEKIIKILESFFGGNLESQFPQIFDSFLNRIAERQGKKSGEFILPTEISSFLMDLANPMSDAKVFNPFAGYSTFGTQLIEEQLYHGQEIDKLIWAVSMMRLNAYDRLTKSVLQNVDTFKNWPSTSKYDLVIANPPFKLRLNEEQQIEFPGIKTVEYFFIKEGYNLLNETGKLISLVPLNFLNSLSDEMDIRKQLIDSDVLETVISFPGGLLMQTNIPFAVLVINKNKKNKDSVLFVQGDKYVKQVNKHKKYLEADKLLEKINSTLSVYSNDNLAQEPQETYKSVSLTDITQEISIEKIIEHNFNLDIERFRLDNLSGTALKTFIKRAPITYVKKDKESFLALNKKEARYISLKDLKNNPFEYHLDLEELVSTNFEPGVNLKGDLLLVSLIHKELKPTFIQSGETFLYIPRNILPLKIDLKNIDLDWFIYKLHSKHISNQISSFVGSSLPRLKIKDFFNLKINLPSLKEQRQEIANLKGTNNEIESLETEIIQQNSFLRHTLAGPVTDLEDAIKNIDGIIRNIEKDYLPEVLSLKRSEKHLFTLGEYLDDSKKYVSVILDTVKSKLNASLDIETKKLEPINLLSFVQSYVERKNSTYPGYEIHCEYDKVSFTGPNGNKIEGLVNANEDLLNRMFDNLIDNAVKHAFSNDKLKRIDFSLYAMVADDFSEIGLIVSNTGKPFPPNFDHNKLTMRGYGHGKNHGDGFGWWYINEIIRKLKGNWYFIDETGPEGLVNTDFVSTFEFNFPMIENYEEL